MSRLHDKTFLRVPLYVIFICYYILSILSLLVRILLHLCIISRLLLEVLIAKKTFRIF